MSLLPPTPSTSTLPPLPLAGVLPPSPASGVLLLRERRHPREPEVIVSCERRARPDKDAPRLTPEQVMDIARLANLRMWDAYRRRDRAIDDLLRRSQVVREVA